MIVLKQKIKQASPEKKKIFENFTAMGIIQILNYVLPFITLPYLARVLDVEKFGLIFFAQATIDYFSRFVDFGFNQSAVRELAIQRDNIEKRNEIYNSVLAAKTGLMIIAFIFLSVIIFSLSKFRTNWLIFYFTFLFIPGNILLSPWFYQGMERMKYITIYNIITRSISLICIFLFIKQSNDYIWVPLFNSLGILLAGIISFGIIIRKFNIKLCIPEVKQIYSKLKESSEYFLSSISIALYQSTNTFFLGLCVSTNMVAYYVSAQKIYLAIYFMYYPFYNAFFPYMSKNKDIKFFKKVFKILLCFSVFLLVFLLLFAKPIVRIFYGEQLIESYHILQIFAIIIPFHILADIMSFPLLGAFGYTKETNQCWIYAGLFHLFGIIGLYIFNYLNIYSVSVLFMITYILMFLHRVYYVKKYNLFNKKTFS